MNSHDNTWNHVRHRGRIVSKLGDLGLAEKSTNTTSDVTSSLAESLSSSNLPFQCVVDLSTSCRVWNDWLLHGHRWADWQEMIVPSCVSRDRYEWICMVHWLGYCCCKIRRKPTVMLFRSPFGRFLARMGRMNLTLLCTCIVVSLHGMSIMQPACRSCL